MPRSPSVRYWLGAILLSVGAGVVIWPLYKHRYVDLIDLKVYRMGGAAIGQDAGIYDLHFEVAGLPFTYPPVSALLMAPVAAIPWWLAATLWTATTVLCLAIVWRVCLPRAHWGLALALVVVSLGLEPVRDNISKGQVNVFLMAMVLVSLLGWPRDDGGAPAPGDGGPTRRDGGPAPRDGGLAPGDGDRVGYDVRTPRAGGIGLGIAAGIKLTPVFFFGLLVLTRRWIALAGALAGLMITVVAGFVALPDASIRYWTEVIRDSGRIGNPEYAGNQSVMGFLARLGHDASWVRPAWFVVASVIGLASLLIARRLWAHDRVAAVSAAALGALFASPVSWNHHWVWAIPLGGALMRLAIAARTKAIAVALWFALFAAGPIWWPPHDRGAELHWSLAQSVVGNAYLLAGLAWFAVVARQRR